MPATLTAPRSTLYARVAPAVTYLNAAKFPCVWFEVVELDTSLVIRAKWLDDGSFADFYIVARGAKVTLDGCFVSFPPPCETIKLDCARCPAEVDASEGPPELYPAALFTAVVLALRGNERTAWRL